MAAGGCGVHAEAAQADSQQHLGELGVTGHLPAADADLLNFGRMRGLDRRITRPRTAGCQGS